MKNTLTVLVLMIFSLNIHAQRDVIDEVFDRYAGKEGVTTVVMTKYLFSMFAKVETDSEEFNDLTSNIESIRIIAVEDSAVNSRLNFYSEIMEKLRRADYELLMMVREEGQDMEFLIKEKGGIIAEFLMVSGGEDGNTLISIRGNIRLESIANLSKSLDIEGLKELEKLDEKK